MCGRCRSGTAWPARCLEVARAAESPRCRRTVASPHRNRRAPESVARDRPVAGVLEPLAESAVANVLGHPGDRLVVREQALLQRGDAHEPGADGAVDQRPIAAPAVRIVVPVVTASNSRRRSASRATIAGTASNTACRRSRARRRRTSRHRAPAAAPRCPRRGTRSRRLRRRPAPGGRRRCRRSADTKSAGRTTNARGRHAKYGKERHVDRPTSSRPLTRRRGADTAASRGDRRKRRPSTRSRPRSNSA